MNQIKKLRINAEMTQADLAKACGVTQGTVSGWENGKCFPGTDKIRLVARALGCDVSVLLEMGEGRKNRPA